MKMRFGLFLIVTLTTVLTFPKLAHGQNQPPTSGLQTAIRTALEQNPKIKSNDKTLEAMLLRVEAAKESKLPTISANYSMSRDSGSISYNHPSEPTSDYKSTNRGGNITLNWTIFDGGAKNKRIQSLECSFKERQATYNSTNTQIRNTQGQVASLVVQFYVSLSRAKQNIAFTTATLEAVTKFRSVARTASDILETDNLIASLTLELKQMEAGYESAARGYKYWVTEAAPAEIDSLQQMIENLRIPSQPEEAMGIAMAKSPEIKAARYQIECSRLRHDSAKATAYSPKVDVYAGHNFGNRSTDLTNGASTARSGGTVGLNVRIPIMDRSVRPELKAQEKEIGSAEDNLTSAIDDTRQDIDSNYPDLNNAIAFANSYKINYDKSAQNIAKYIQAIDNHQSISISEALKETGNLSQTWFSYQRYTVEVLNIKFKIQKTIGILFESLGLQENGSSQITLQ